MKSNRAPRPLVDNLADNPAYKQVCKKNRRIIHESEQEDTGLMPRRTLDIRSVDNYI